MMRALYSVRVIQLMFSPSTSFIHSLFHLPNFHLALIPSVGQVHNLLQTCCHVSSLGDVTIATTEIYARKLSESNLIIPY